MKILNLDFIIPLHEGRSPPTIHQLPAGTIAGSIIFSYNVKKWGEDGQFGFEKIKGHHLPMPASVPGGFFMIFFIFAGLPS